VIEGPQARVADVRLEGRADRRGVLRAIFARWGAGRSSPSRADRQATENRYADLGYIAAEVRDR
jgi:hypothetical protein